MFFGGAKIRKNLIWWCTKSAKKITPFIKITNKKNYDNGMPQDSNPRTWNVVVIPYVSTLQQHPLGQPLCCSSLRLRFASGLLSANKFASVILSDIRGSYVRLQYKKTFKENSASSIDLKSPSYSVLFLFEFPRFYCFLIFSANAAKRSASLTMQFGSSWKSKSSPWFSIL